MGGHRSSVWVFVFAVTCMVLIPLFCADGMEPKGAIGAAPNKAETLSKIQKVSVPFILNEGQADKSVKYYAKTFGGTVSVTENGEILYFLPAAGGGKRNSANGN